MTFDKIISSFEIELHKRYEISSTIRHRGEKGRQREHGLSKFLKENLPEAYGVATGEIISEEKKLISPQCDIIVYDRLRTPIIGKYDAVQQIPIEGVYSVIEMKSTITKTAFRDAAHKFNKIRKMCPSPSKIISEGKRFGPFFFLFGYQMKTNVPGCKEFLIKHAKGEDTSVVALDTGATVWVGPDDYSKPGRPEWLPGTDFEFDSYGTLALFFTELMEVCKYTELGSINFKKLYIGI